MSPHETEVLFKWIFRKKFVCTPVKSSISHSGVGGDLRFRHQRSSTGFLLLQKGWAGLTWSLNSQTFHMILSSSWAETFSAKVSVVTAFCTMKFKYSEVGVWKKKVGFVMKTRICACWVCKSALWNCKYKQPSGGCDPQVWLLATAQGNAHSSGIYPDGPGSFPDLEVKELILSIKGSKRSKCPIQEMDQSSGPANPPVGWETSNR